MLQDKLTVHPLADALQDTSLSDGESGHHTTVTPLSAYIKYCHVFHCVF